MTNLTFDAFWTWLQQHPNCIVRAGTPDALLYDDEDLHWYVGPDGDALVVQLIRGKHLVGELVLDPERASYVEDLGADAEGEHSFEAVRESTEEREAVYSFVLTHGLEDESEETHGPAVLH